MGNRTFNSRSWLARTFSGRTWGNDGASTPPPSAQVGGPDWGITAANIAIVFDSSNTDSVAVKDYLIDNRPGYADCVLCPINLSGKLAGMDGFEQISQANFTSTIAPALQALDSDVLYLIWVWGTPTRILDNETLSPLAEEPRTIPSVQMQAARLGASGARYDAGQITGQTASWSGFDFVDGRFLPSNADDYPGTRFLSSHISFKTLADTYAYIDKVAAAHPGGNQVVIYGNNRYGTEYWLDDNRSNGPSDVDYTFFPHAIHYKTELEAENASATINYYEDDTDPVMQSANRVKGLHTWGHHSNDVPNPMSQGTWTDGSADGLAISILSNWWLFNCTVSWNGRRGSEAMNAFISTAFGGTGYSSTPVGFAAHVEEARVESDPFKRLFRHWERGYLLIECGWANRTNIHFVLYGDPMVSGGVFSSTFARVTRGQLYVAGASRAQAFVPGGSKAQAYVPGAAQGQLA